LFQSLLDGREEVFGEVKCCLSIWSSWVLLVVDVVEFFQCLVVPWIIVKKMSMHREINALSVCLSVYLSVRPDC
jgi:hypothetical protein